MGIKPGEEKHIKNVDELKKALRGYIDYQSSSGLEGFPDSKEEVVEIPMSPGQLSTYRYLQGKLPWWGQFKISHNLPPSKRESKDMNAFLQGLRQVGLSETPYNAALTPLQAAERSSKLTRIADDIDEMRHKDKNFRGFVYSNYTGAGLSPLQALLHKRGVKASLIHGGLSAKERTQLVDDYNAGKMDVLLGSAAAAEGLNLRGTRYVGLAEPHHNTARIAQAMARGVRYKSHDHLPQSERNVIIRHYLSTLPKGWFGKKEYGVDENLRSRSAEKQRLIDEMTEIMKDVT
jgi:hypothetical protein